MENVEPVAVGDVDLGLGENDENAFVFNAEFEGVAESLPVANDDAILEMSELFCPGLKPVACGCRPVGDDVPFVWGCCVFP